MKGRQVRVALGAALLSFLSFLALPSAEAAFRSGISPLDRVMPMIAGIFNLPSLQNEAVAVGVARFAFFLIIFSLLNWIARKWIFKGDDPTAKRTANIVTFMLSFLSTFFVPKAVVLSAGMGYSTIIWTLITTGPAIAALYFAFRGNQQEPTVGQRVVEFLALLLGFLWSWFMYENLVNWMKTSFPFPRVGEILEYINTFMFLVMFIAFIIKIGQIMGAWKALGSGASSAWDRLTGRTGSTGSTGTSTRRGHTEEIAGFGGRLLPPNPPGGTVAPTSAELYWNPVTDATSYQVEASKWAVLNWHSIGTVVAGATYSATSPYAVASLPFRVPPRPGDTLRFRIRAFGPRGKGKWKIAELVQPSSLTSTHEADLVAIESRIADIRTFRNTLRPIASAVTAITGPAPVLKANGATLWTTGLGGGEYWTFVSQIHAAISTLAPLLADASDILRLTSDTETLRTLCEECEQDYTDILNHP